VAIQVAEGMIGDEFPKTQSGEAIRPVYRISPIEDSRWTEYLAKNASASLFHSPTWLQALRRSYAYDPVLYTTNSPGKTLKNGLVACVVESRLTGRRLVSVPFSDYCQPLAEETSDLLALMRAAETDVAASNSRYFELRPRTSIGVSRTKWQVSAVYLHHEIDLSPGINVLYKNLHKDSIQRKIQRAKREGLGYESGRTERLLDAFYKIMVQTRRRHGVPPQPKHWFRILAEEFGDSLQIRVAFHGTKAVAATMTIRYKDTLVYKYGGSEVKHNKLGGMHMLYWNAIEDAKKWELRSFDLGRTDMHQHGLATFKRRWGALESSIAYSRYPEAGNGGLPNLSEPKFRTRVGQFVFRQTPNQLLPLLGNLLYRHFG
jgi:CelD/BcsL family acetyltransferase involved in cellulose biosynthesis